MNVEERSLIFHCGAQRLLGVLSLPPWESRDDLGMVMVVGGPQSRVGSHRQFVLQARAAAAAGVPTLRFDVRGMGDSEGDLRSFEHLDDDIGAAIEALQQALPGVRRVVLWGLCDGASAALLYLDGRAHDARVHGLVLVNPWVRSEATLAAMQVKHYYLDRLRQREFWAKLLRGQVAAEALRGWIRSVGLTLRPKTVAGASAPGAASGWPFQHRMARAWAHFSGPVLLVLSGNDYTAKEFLQAWQSPDWAAARGNAALHRLNFADADHTFSRAKDQQAMQEACVGWLCNLVQRAV